MPNATAFRRSLEEQGEPDITGEATGQRSDGGQRRVKFHISRHDDGTFVAMLWDTDAATSASTKVMTTGDVLAAWRDAERRMETIDQGSPEWSTIQADIARFREAYQRAFEGEEWNLQRGCDADRSESAYHPRMIDEPVSVADLLQAWRDAIRAAELAERMTRVAVKTADEADVRYEAAREIATLAAQAAEYAARAGERATAAANEAAVLAEDLREQGITAAQAVQSTARQEESEASARYHLAEAGPLDGG